MPQVNWKDLPADLLGRVVDSSQDSYWPATARSIARGQIRSVCSDWQNSLDSIALALKLGSSELLPLNLVQRFPSITVLEAYHCVATQPGKFLELAGLPLTDLTIPMGLDDIAPDNIAVLRGLPLTRLDLLGVDLSKTDPELVLTDARLKLLEGLPLVNLCLSGWTPNGRYFRWINFSDAGLAPLRGMPLKTLALKTGPAVTDAGIDALRGNTTLTTLRLYRGRGECNISAAGLSALVSAPLVALYLNWGFPVTDAGLAVLGKISTLQTLRASNCAGVTDEGIRALAALPKLEYLHLSGCRVPADALAAAAPPPAAPAAAEAAAGGGDASAGCGDPPSGSRDAAAGGGDVPAAGEASGGAAAADNRAEAVTGVLAGAAAGGGDAVAGGDAEGVAAEAAGSALAAGNNAVAVPRAAAGGDGAAAASGGALAGEAVDVAGGEAGRVEAGGSSAPAVPGTTAVAGMRAGADHDGSGAGAAGGGDAAAGAAAADRRCG